jgi:lipid-binding SYLF domain-containing protein
MASFHKKKERYMRSSLVLSCMVVGAFSLYSQTTENEESKRVESSISVLNDIQAVPDSTIPEYLFKKGEGIAIFPNVLKAAFGLGGRWGKGIMLVRTAKGSWSDPCFITFAGGSVGWQIGGESSDFILVFRTKKSIEGMTSGKLTLGGDASVSAGPVGRNAEASTDIQLKAEIYTYAKSRGLFAGISVEGTSLSIDDGANAVFYKNKGIKARTLFAGRVAKEPPIAAKLIEAVKGMEIGRVEKSKVSSAKTGSE